MAHYHFRVRDRYERVLAENDIEEVDSSAACRAVLIALSLFTFSYGAAPGAFVELDDCNGQTIARIGLDGKLL